MINYKPIVKFIGFLVFYYIVLMLPITPLMNGYAAIYRTIGEGIFGGMWPNIAVEFHKQHCIHFVLSHQFLVSSTTKTHAGALFNMIT